MCLCTGESSCGCVAFRGRLAMSREGSRCSFRSGALGGRRPSMGGGIFEGNINFALKNFLIFEAFSLRAVNQPRLPAPSSFVGASMLGV